MFPNQPTPTWVVKVGHGAFKIRVPHCVTKNEKSQFVFGQEICDNLKQSAQNRFYSTGNEIRTHFDLRNKL